MWRLNTPFFFCLPAKRKNLPPGKINHDIVSGLKLKYIFQSKNFYSNTKINVVLSSLNGFPKINKPWFFSITVSNLKYKVDTFKLENTNIRQLPSLESRTFFYQN